MGVLKRVMTGMVALVVAVFSLSMFGILWKLQTVRMEALPIVLAEAPLRWEGEHLIGEIYMKNGALERFILYRKANDGKMA